MPDLAQLSRAQDVFTILQATYPDAHCELDYQSPFQLLIATILSAQSTDQRVNIVTPALFERFPNPAALAQAEPSEIESIIHSTGFFRQKAKFLLATAQTLQNEYAGEVPRTLTELTRLPGVARKTANVVLGECFGASEGVVVDTHVRRLSQRLGFTSEEDPTKIERDLQGLYEPVQWVLLSHLLIWHGRRLCSARKPNCSVCPLAHLCPSASTS
jgi:endonuclease-3